MARRRRQSRQGRLLVAELICRICHYITFDVDDFGNHYNNHMLEASVTFYGRRILLSQQQRRRNLYCNPFQHSLPSSLPCSALTTSSASSGRSCPRQQENTGGSVTRDHSTNAQVVFPDDVSQVAWTGTEEQSNESTRLLINQLERPIPEIIDLEEDEDDARSSSMDMALHL
ncbi:hypothetical protein Nepgr_020711 [Nepenthes gracilis]|uniref:Uncharacterized protein n=1 Tax=Nepenthes gracilis TaxID=150966 RepID=A0AAD3XWI5_NEPGR|nr:hypothetical protein Nepgr_020711 [Nepenthes gracilis]